MADRITLLLKPRDTLGKKVKALRRSGVVPVHLYGSGISSRALQCQGQELIKVLAQAGGNTPISITVDGEGDDHLAFVREVQWDPIRGELLHVDFLRTELTQRVSAEVPIVLTGASTAAMEASRSVVQQLRTLTVEALPLEMPQDCTADASTLTELDSVIRAGDIPLPPTVTLLTDPDALVARIEVAKVVPEEEVSAAEAEPGDAAGQEPQE